MPERDVIHSSEVSTTVILLWVSTIFFASSMSAWVNFPRVFPMRNRVIQLLSIYLLLAYSSMDILAMSELYCESHDAF